jgi:hypothetical protein
VHASVHTVIRVQNTRSSLLVVHDDRRPIVPPCRQRRQRRRPPRATHRRPHPPGPGGAVARKAVHEAPVLCVPHLTPRPRRDPLRRLPRRPPAPAAVPRDSAHRRRHPVRRPRDAVRAARSAQPEPRRGLPLRPAPPVGAVP